MRKDNYRPANPAFFSRLALGELRETPIEVRFEERRVGVVDLEISCSIGMKLGISEGATSLVF